MPESFFHLSAKEQEEALLLDSRLKAIPDSAFTIQSSYLPVKADAAAVS
jgi:hypothetical protein